MGSASNAQPARQSPARDKRPDNSRERKFLREIYELAEFAAAANGMLNAFRRSRRRAPVRAGKRIPAQHRVR